MFDQVNDIVNAVIGYYDNTENATYLQAPQRENRIIHYLQRAAEDVWYYRPWSFTMSSASLTMVAGAAAFPTDFAQVGPEGGLLDSNNIPWVEIAHQDMMVLRARHLEQQKHFFSVGTNIQVVNPTDTRAFLLLYQMQTPTMAAGAGTGFPKPFGQVLLLGTVARLKKDEGDPNQDWRADYAMALSRMATQWQSRSRVQQMPTTNRGMW